MKHLTNRAGAAGRVAAGTFAAAAAAIASTSALSQTTLITFDTYPNGSPVLSSDALTTQWSSWGVTFSDSGTGAIYPYGSSCSYSLPYHVGADVVVVRFIDPVTGGPAVVKSAGCRQDWCWGQGEGIDMKAYDAAGQLLAAQFNAGGGNLVTFTMDAPRIAMLRLVPIGQGVDDLQFTEVVPLRPGDIDGDGTVGPIDLGLLLGAWGPCGPVCPSDINHSGAVDAADLGMLLGGWG